MRQKASSVNSKASTEFLIRCVARPVERDANRIETGTSGEITPAKSGDSLRIGLLRGGRNRRRQISSQSVLAERGRATIVLTRDRPCLADRSSGCDPVPRLRRITARRPVLVERVD